MGVRKKRRNKLSVNGREYVWYVADDDSTGGHLLHVLSEDKHFNVQYGIRQPDDQRFITVVGNEFSGIATSGCWRRFRCPEWENDGVITPKSVRSLIDWALDEEAERLEVDSNGLRLSS